jgi:D-beta-D-heptose 7-phosphate kinase/D-beta-D-heptose 1-phosphate adenosyltransferase
MIRDKVIPISEIRDICRKLRGQGKTIVFSNGCFDLIHAGHVEYLEQAKGLGDVLVIGLNSDASVKRLKGNSRPIVPEDERAEVLAALESVDYVVVFEEDTPYDLIREVAPGILVKGGDWKTGEIVGADLVTARGGKVHNLHFRAGVSTSGIISRILELDRDN